MPEENDKNYKSLEQLRIDVAVAQRDIKSIGEDIKELKDSFAVARAEAREDVHALRNAMIAFTTTIAGTAIATLLAFLTGLVDVTPK